MAGLCQVAWAQTAADGASVNLPDPAMVGSLAFPAMPAALRTGALGTWYVDGVVSGLGLVQSNAVAGDRGALLDFSNAQLIVQKPDGLVQFYVQAGAYAIPELGVPYGRLTDSASTWGRLYSALPEGYLKIAPTSNFSIEAGRLPTLIGPEDNFTFENFSVEHGLLWNQEPTVSRGVQADLTVGPVVFNVAFNDGYYSGRFNWVAGEATWTINAANTLVFDATGNLGRTPGNSFATPLSLNNGSIYDLIYTYKHGKLTLTPYVQYTQVERDPSVGIYSNATSTGGAVIAYYAFTKLFGLAGRFEYLSSSGGKSAVAPTNLLYGPGSGAASFTLTPTVTWKQYFARAEASVVALDGVGAGDGFGRGGRADTQVRGLVEAGVVF